MFICGPPTQSTPSLTRKLKLLNQLFSPCGSVLTFSLLVAQKTFAIFRYLSNYAYINLLFKALRDPTRRRILEMLKERDLTVGEISDAFSMTAPSISYHLDLLKQAQLVSSEKSGQFVIYSLETTVLDDSLGWILDLMKKGSRKRK